MNPLVVEMIERTATTNRIIDSMLMLRRLDVPIATTRITAIEKGLPVARLFMHGRCLDKSRILMVSSFMFLAGDESQVTSECSHCVLDGS